MAFRIEKAAVRGELSNEERGVVTGSIWLAGREEPLRLRLRGDCLRDLAGCTVCFANPQAEADPTLAVLAPDQSGVSGEMTASRKIRQPAVSHEEMLDLLDQGQPVPVRLANGLYLEWYSVENGRVVLETTDYTVTVSLPAWRMTAKENADQIAASQHHFQRFLLTITGDAPETADDAEHDEEVPGETGAATGHRPGSGGGSDSDEPAADAEDDEDDEDGEDGEDDEESEEGEPLNEFEWEQELRDADRRAEAYQEALEKYRDHPHRERLIAAALGWAEDDDDDDDDERTDAMLREVLMDDSMEIFDGTGVAPAWVEGTAEIGESGEDSLFGSHHPLSQRAMDFALVLQREAEERGLMTESLEDREPGPVLALIMHIISLGGKLAGALDGWAQGHEPDPGFIIAMLKRAQLPLNEALHAFDGIDASALNAETRLWLQSRKRDLFDLRREVIDLMHQLRTS